MNTHEIMQIVKDREREKLFLISKANGKPLFNFRETKRENRIAWVMNGVLGKIPGNVIEIGCGFGDVTCVWSKVVERYDKRVICVDPFEKSFEKSIGEEYYKDYCEPYTKAKFRATTKDCKNIVLIEECSTSKVLKDLLAEYKPFSFSFLDGIQTKDVILNDLKLMQLMEVPVICVDDMNRLTDKSQVPLGVKEFIKDDNYVLMDFITQQEAYMVRNNLI